MFCYSCLKTGDENTKVRGARHRCVCARGTWSAYCSSEDLADHVAQDPYPRDVRCGCPICPTCRPGAPCEQCDGTCGVCRGLVAPGPEEFAQGVVDAEADPSWSPFSGLFAWATPPAPPSDAGPHEGASTVTFQL